MNRSVNHTLSGLPDAGLAVGRGPRTAPRMAAPPGVFAPGWAPSPADDGTAAAIPMTTGAIRPAAPFCVSAPIVTPSRARLLLAGVLLLGAGVAFNALLLQRGGPGIAAEPNPPHATAKKDLLTGPSEAAPAGIKTAGLPPPPSSRIEAELKVWQARLRQLEAEARGVLAPEVSPPASTPARVEDDPLAPVTQQTVRALQRELTQRGYDPGPVDGNIGLMTRAAIMAFEHDEGLALSGEPSERLLRRVILGDTGEVVADRDAARGQEAAGRLIRSVQQALASLKYAPGEADGHMSEETSRAIREFEMDQGLVPTGRVSGRLIVRLARASGKAFMVPVR